MLVIKDHRYKNHARSYHCHERPKKSKPHRGRRKKSKPCANEVQQSVLILELGLRSQQFILPSQQLRKNLSLSLEKMSALSLRSQQSVLMPLAFIRPQSIRSEACLTRSCLAFSHYSRILCLCSSLLRVLQSLVLLSISILVSLIFFTGLRRRSVWI
jgi:hypothetical protein